MYNYYTLQLFIYACLVINNDLVECAVILAVFAASVWRWWCQGWRFAGCPPGDATDAMRAVAQVAARPFTAGGGESVGGETAPPHIIEDTAGHIAMKKLLTNDVTRLAAGQIGMYCRHQGAVSSDCGS